MTYYDPAAPWPPPNYAKVAADVARAGAWYKGEPGELAGLYPDERGGTVATKSPLVRSFFGGRSANAVNSNSPKSGAKLLKHMPVASDIASVSADMLFGEPCSYVIPEAHATGNLQKAAKITEQAIADMADEDGWDSTLLESAEVCSGYGAVYLVPQWIAEENRPILTFVMPGNAVPIFRNRRMVGVTFWSVIDESEKQIVRHLERHTAGLVEHFAYVGTATSLGEPYPLAAFATTKGLMGAKEGGRVDLTPIGIKGLDCALIPNALPNRLNPESGVGRSDTAGNEDAMNDLDFTWQSWIRDLRLGQARILVPQEFLGKEGRGKGAGFDFDREVFVPLDMEEARAGKSIEVTDFTLRVDEHETTVKALFTQVVQGAGYSPGSFGLPDEGAMQTATEVNAKAGRSERTTGRKQRYYRRGQKLVTMNMQRMAVGWGGARFVPMDCEIIFPDGADANIRETASTLNLLSLAKAASTRTKVAMLHPDWDEPAILAEAALIIAEEAGPMQVDPFGVGGEDDLSAAEDTPAVDPAAEDA
ncbi:Portal protein [uncultured Caudovirales phage]|uniref:Portal protein n=1 Tax=uncultured Caudovirales phage TaxID=2100421 RepID=A0A6J5S4C9_9CAUD|nr:Portal protein [uncultured Caudovirales phage]